MKRSLIIFFTLAVFVVLALPGCTDQNAVIDQNTELVNSNWSYSNKLKYAVKIDDASIAYNLCLNLRVTADYKYSNIFVLMHETGPGIQSPVAVRYEFKLANKDGEWLGAGSGNIYSYQIPFSNNYKFPAKGTYYFELEQNMRDNPLREVSDVGLRVEKAQGQ